MDARVCHLWVNGQDRGLVDVAADGILTPTGNHREDADLFRLKAGPATLRGGYHPPENGHLEISDRNYRFVKD